MSHLDTPRSLVLSAGHRRLHLPTPADSPLPHLTVRAMPLAASNREKHSHGMSAREDYELADAAQNARDQQDLDPLLPPEYKNITSADEYATSPSAHGLRLGGEADSAASRAASRRSVFTSLALTTSTLLVVILAAPLFMLWRNGIFDDGTWRQALGAHRPAPDHGSFPTE